MPVDQADLVAAAVRAVPGVTDLHTGSFGEVATYLPGRRVGGVRLSPQRCEVHIVVAWGVPVRDIAAAVRTAVAALVDTPVDVTVEDVVDANAASAVTTTTTTTTSPSGHPAGSGTPANELTTTPTAPGTTPARSRPLGGRTVPPSTTPH